MKWVASKSTELLVLGIIQKDTADCKKDCGKHSALGGTLIFFLWKKKKFFMWGPKFFKTTDDKTMKIIFIFPKSLQQ